jgi:ADP-ribosyl-[dinitrogen reductase] hydrolase
MSGESSRRTHGAAACIDACRYYSALIVGALSGVNKKEILATQYSPVRDYWKTNPLVPEISAIAAGSFRNKEPPAIRGTGYVVDALEAALWAFYRSDTFREGLLMAVNLGDDADTTGAIYRQLAGAYYGQEAIPASWRTKLAKAELIASFAEKLFALASNG